MTSRGLVAVGVVAGLIVGAAGAGCTQKPGPTPVAKAPVKVFSTGGEALNNCKTFTDKYHPDRLILITLPGKFDVNNLSPVITEMDVTASPWTQGNPAAPEPPPSSPTWTPRTKLDLNLGLVANPSGKKVDKVLIEVLVEDTSVHFRSDGYAIEAGDKTGNSDKMFCQIPGGYQAQYATFMAFYYTDNNGTKPTMGSYNVGLVLGDGMPYDLPIFLDPDVMNNG